MITTENLEDKPLLARDNSPLIETQERKLSNWTTVYRRKRRIVFLPHQLMEWMYDHIPACPIPKDAMFHKLQFDGRERYLVFDFYSLDAPEVKAVRLSFDELTSIFRTILREKLPLDAELCGLYQSELFAYLMAEFQSDKLPEATNEVDTMVQMRYEGKQLILAEYGKPIQQESV